MLATPGGKELAQCVDCHIPEGFVGTVYAYLHFASVTDFFGSLRDRDSERAGEWIPPRAATAYRVRDGLFENDSATCRTCHAGPEIKSERRAVQKTHELAVKKQKTCIECHRNLVHRSVDKRKTAFKRSPSPAEK